MFMGRLALQRGGEAIDDPLTWFDELPDGVVEFWKAFYQLEPFGSEWHRHAKLCQMLHSVGMRVASGEGEQVSELSDHMPPDYVKLDFAKANRVPIGKQLDALAKAHTKKGN